MLMLHLKYFRHFLRPNLQIALHQLLAIRSEKKTWNTFTVSAMTRNNEQNIVNFTILPVIKTRVH